MFGLKQIKAVQNTLLNALVLITVATEQIRPDLLPVVGVAGFCLVTATACMGSITDKKQGYNGSKKPTKVQLSSNNVWCQHLPAFGSMRSHAVAVWPICKLSCR